MKPSRRNLLKFIGLAPAAPLALKVASDAKIAALTGVSLNGHPGVGGSAGPPLGDYSTAQINASAYFDSLGLPEFVQETFRRQSKYVSYLDPDIAAKKSWSMAAKIVTQQERNYERVIEGIRASAVREQGRSLFKTVTGWDWPL